MRLDGIHHITAITGDPQRCLDFYAGVLGLSPVTERASTAPAQESFALGEPDTRSGGVLSFLVRPGTRRGRPGAGMAHTIVWRVEDPDALDFWAKRLAAGGIATERRDPERGVSVSGDNGAGHAPMPALRFCDPEGLAHELVGDRSGAEPLFPSSSVVPPRVALRGLEGVRTYARAPEASADLLAGRLGFAATGGSAYLVAGRSRRATYFLDEAPPARGVSGAGTVDHIAWSCEEGEQRAWRERVIGLGARATPVREDRGRHFFRFREPSGVSFEITTGAPEHQLGPTLEGAPARRPNGVRPPRLPARAIARAANA